jgi:hypothetical protein
VFQDDRFLLIDQAGEKMPAAIVRGEYRFGKSKLDGVKDLATFATGIIKSRKSGRFVTLHGRNTIKIGGNVAVGYELEPNIAATIGVPARG